MFDSIRSFIFSIKLDFLMCDNVEYLELFFVVVIFFILIIELIIML